MNYFNTETGNNRLPPILKSIIIINVACWLLEKLLTSFSDLNPFHSLALYNWESENFKPWQLFSYMFLHDQVDIFHLALNMFGIWVFGSLLEQYWGSRRFLFYYLSTGIGAGVIYLIFMSWQVTPMLTSAEYYMQNPGYEAFEQFVSLNLPGSYDNEGINNFLQLWYNNRQNPTLISESVDMVQKICDHRLNTPMVGASGALFGIMLAFAMLFPNLSLFIFLIPIPVKAKYVVLAYGIFEILATLKNDLNDNIAHVAHLGGMIVGFLLVIYWKKTDPQKTNWEYD